MDLQLIRLVGRSELPGHPFLYGTTQIFLDHFGLANLQQLNELDPTLQRSNPRLKAEQYKRVEKKTELEKAAEEAAKEAAEAVPQPAAETPAPTDSEFEPQDELSQDIEPQDESSPAKPTVEEDDFFIDDTPDEFDDEDEDDEDEEEDIDEEEEEDEDDK